MSAIEASAAGSGHTPADVHDGQAEEDRQEMPRLAQGENCPCKRIGCPRWGDCEACCHHHHLPGKKLPASCERQKAKKGRNKSKAAGG